MAKIVTAAPRSRRRNHWLPTATPMRLIVGVSRGIYSSSSSSRLRRMYQTPPTTTTTAAIPPISNTRVVAARSCLRRTPRRSPREPRSERSAACDRALRRRRGNRQWSATAAGRGAGGRRRDGTPLELGNGVSPVAADELGLAGAAARHRSLGGRSDRWRRAAGGAEGTDAHAAAIGTEAVGGPDVAAWPRDVELKPSQLVGAVRLEDVAVPQHRVRRVVVDLVLHLLDDHGTGVQVASAGAAALYIWS